MTSTPNALYQHYTEINLSADQSRSGRLDFVLDELQLARTCVLDVACGPGVQFLGHVTRHQFTGIDVSPSALAMAEANGYKTLLHDVTQGLPFSDGEFGLVVMTDILEHLVDPAALLSEARRVLTKDGYAVISVPNHFFLWNRLRILVGRGLVLPWSNHQAYSDWNYFHLRFGRWSSFLNLLRQSGFKLEREYCHRFLAPLPPILRVPCVRQAMGAVRRLVGNRDLWALHFLVVCTKSEANAADG